MSQIICNLFVATYVLTAKMTLLLHYKILTSVLGVVIA